jgi:uncharacterized protein (TIGR03435 family)
MQLMIRSLLEERFQLRSHSEMRELPVYVLSVGKDGSKLKTAIEGAPGLEGMSPGSTRTDGSNGKAQMVGTAVPMRTLVVLLSQQLQRPVIDKTNLTGTFDFALKWFGAPNPAAVFTAGPEIPPPAESDGPSIFAAVQEQLGLKLDSAKGPAEVLIIDRVERPSEN